jgi:hypothetical protein
MAAAETVIENALEAEIGNLLTAAFG